MSAQRDESTTEISNAEALAHVIAGLLLEPRDDVTIAGPTSYGPNGAWLEVNVDGDVFDVLVRGRED